MGVSKSPFQQLQHQGIRESTIPVPWLVNFTFYPYLTILSVKHRNIKYYLLFLNRNNYMKSDTHEHLIVRENGFEVKKKRSRRYPAKTITDADYADDIAILVLYTHIIICLYTHIHIYAEWITTTQW